MSEALNFNVGRMKWRKQNDIERKSENAKERANNKGNMLRCIFCFTKDILKAFYPYKWQMAFDYFKTHYLKIKYVLKHISFYESSCMIADKNVK